MIVLNPVAPHNAMVLKEVRLRALQDAPKAFGSTYARESQLSDEEWIKRSVQWGSGKSAAFLATENGVACGIAASVDRSRPPPERDRADAGQKNYGMGEPAWGSHFAIDGGLQQRSSRCFLRAPGIQAHREDRAVSKRSGLVRIRNVTAASPRLKRLH